jgi:hypothetical protein
MRAEYESAIRTIATSYNSILAQERWIGAYNEMNGSLQNGSRVLRFFAANRIITARPLH